MRPKQLIYLFVAVILLGAGWTIYSKRHTFFPSQQMIQLRQLEASLDLPKPKYRSEEDLGLNRDSKGSLHYDRHIALSYEDESILNMIRSKLLKDSWQEKSVDSIGSNNYFLFMKGDGDAMQCVGGYTGPQDSDGITLYVSLEASGEYSCNPAPGT